VRLAESRHRFIQAASAVVADTLLVERPGEVARPEVHGDAVAARIRSSVRFIWPFATACATCPRVWEQLGGAAASMASTAPPPPGPRSSPSGDAAAQATPQGSPSVASPPLPPPLASRPRGPDGRPVAIPAEVVPSGAGLVPRRLEGDPLVAKQAPLAPILDVRRCWCARFPACRVVGC